MIFCVEDDDSIRELVLYTLQATQIEAKGFENGARLFEALKHDLPDLIVLDLMLPDMDGLQILKKIRSQEEWAALPILIASAKGSEFDKVIGLDQGADDYIVKPYGMMELVSRIKALLRRVRPQKTDCLVLGALKLDLKRHEAYIEGRGLDLTRKEFELLKILMKHPGQVFTREQLLESIWDYSYIGQTRTVDVHIGTLRNKLHPYKEYLKTVRGVGYKMETIA